jgi:hypothetical protein
MTRRLWIAVPAYNGSVTCETAEALNAEVYEAIARGWHYVVQFYQQDPIISYARNFLVMRFLASDFTDMVFVDTDVGFPMGTLCKLADYDVDIVGASYPYRVEPTNYPVRWLDSGSLTPINAKTGKPSTQSDVGPDGHPVGGLLQVAGLPTGCMAIKRHVLEKLIELHPELRYKDRTGEDSYALFDFKVRDGQFFGEDYTFCNYATDAGFKIWLDPNLDMTHTGTKVYKGNIARWLRSRAEPIGDPMENILKFAREVENLGDPASKTAQIARQGAVIELARGLQAGRG